MNKKHQMLLDILETHLETMSSTDSGGFRYAANIIKEELEKLEIKDSRDSWDKYLLEADLGAGKFERFVVQIADEIRFKERNVKIIAAFCLLFPSTHVKSIKVTRVEWEPISVNNIVFSKILDSYKLL